MATFIDRNVVSICNVDYTHISVYKVADPDILVGSGYSEECYKYPVCRSFPVNLNLGSGSGQSKFRLGLPQIMRGKCCVGGVVAIH